MYNYQNERAKIFTEDGSVIFNRIRDHVKATLEKSGAITMEAAMIGSGDSWTQMACVDRLIELHEIREIPISYEVPGQLRTFWRMPC